MDLTVSDRISPALKPSQLYLILRPFYWALAIFHRLTYSEEGLKRLDKRRVRRLDLHWLSQKQFLAIDFKKLSRRQVHTLSNKQLKWIRDKNRLDELTSHLAFGKLLEQEPKLDAKSLSPRQLLALIPLALDKTNDRCDEAKAITEKLSPQNWIACLAKTASLRERLPEKDLKAIVDYLLRFQPKDINRHLNRMPFSEEQTIKSFDSLLSLETPFTDTIRHLLEGKNIPQHHTSIHADKILHSVPRPRLTDSNIDAIYRHLPFERFHEKLPFKELKISMCKQLARQAAAAPQGSLLAQNLSKVFQQQPSADWISFLRGLPFKVVFFFVQCRKDTENRAIMERLDWAKQLLKTGSIKDEWLLNLLVQVQSATLLDDIFCSRPDYLEGDFPLDQASPQFIDTLWSHAKKKRDAILNFFQHNQTTYETFCRAEGRHTFAIREKLNEKMPFSGYCNAEISKELARIKKLEDLEERYNLIQIASERGLTHQLDQVDIDLLFDCFEEVGKEIPARIQFALKRQSLIAFIINSNDKPLKRYVKLLNLDSNDIAMWQTLSQDFIWKGSAAYLAKQPEVYLDIDTTTAEIELCIANRHLPSPTRLSLPEDLTTIRAIMAKIAALKTSSGIHFIGFRHRIAEMLYPLPDTVDLRGDLRSFHYHTSFVDTIIANKDVHPIPYHRTALIFDHCKKENFSQEMIHTLLDQLSISHPDDPDGNICTKKLLDTLKGTSDDLPPIPGGLRLVEDYNTLFNKYFGQGHALSTGFRQFLRNVQQNQIHLPLLYHHSMLILDILKKEDTNIQGNFDKIQAALRALAEDGSLCADGSSVETARLTYFILTDKIAQLGKHEAWRPFITQAAQNQLRTTANAAASMDGGTENRHTENAAHRYLAVARLIDLVDQDRHGGIGDGYWNGSTGFWKIFPTMYQQNLLATLQSEINTRLRHKPSTMQTLLSEFKDYAKKRLHTQLQPIEAAIAANPTLKTHRQTINKKIEAYDASHPLISEDNDIPSTDNLPQAIQDEINTYKETIKLHRKYNEILVEKISNENWIYVDETTGKQSLTPLGALALAYHCELILEPGGVF